jgi:hypothetical protein
MSGTSSAAGFCCYGGRGSSVTVLAARSSQRYRLQCDTLPPLCLLTAQLVERLSRHFSRQEDFTCSYSSSLPLHELFSEIGTHFLFREKARKIQVSTSLLFTFNSSSFSSSSQPCCFFFSSAPPSQPPPPPTLPIAPPESPHFPPASPPPPTIALSHSPPPPPLLLQ